MTTDEGREVTCPVCKTQGTERCLESQGMVYAAAEALVSGDDTQIILAFENSNHYDFHIAVTMFVDAMVALSEYACVDFDELLRENRRQLNEAILRHSSSPGSPDPS